MTAYYLDGTPVPPTRWADKLGLPNDAPAAPPPAEGPPSKLPSGAPAPTPDGSGAKP